MIVLDERLTMLAALTPACRMAADIGADHGFLGAWLLECGKCERVQFLDISAPSLKKAERLIRAHALTDRAIFSVGDGAQALKETPDAVIIAGMGASTIMGILQRGQSRLKDAALILQPNVGVEQLRRFLMLNGWRIISEDLARAGGRWYVGLCAARGQAQYDERELLAGPMLLKEKHPLLNGYIDFRLKVQRRAYEGAQNGDAGRASQLACEIALWEDIRQWLRQSETF